MPSDLPKLFTAAMPRVRIADEELPWVFAVKPVGRLLQEDGFALLTEAGEILLAEDINTKSQVVRTGAMPPVRTANG